MLRNCVFGIIAFVGIIFIIDLARFYILIRKGNALAKVAVPFSRVLPGAPMKILILGDSTAVGTGAETPEVSTAGRIASPYPEATVENLGVNGLRLTGLVKTLENINPDDHYSIIVVQIGANDIMRLTSMDDIKSDAEKVVSQLSKQTDKLIILHSGDIGSARIFPFYLRPLLSKRSYQMRDIYRALAKQYGARYVDLIDSPVQQLLNNDPKKYYAKDFLHLNGAGYGLWFQEIEKSI